MKIGIGEVASSIYLFLLAISFIRWGLKRLNVGGIKMKQKFSQQVWSLYKAHKLISTFIIVGILLQCFDLYLFIAQPSWQIINFHTIQVYEPFRPFYRIHMEELGNPKEEVQLETQAYEASHEHAIILWLNGLSKYYVLQRDDYSWRDWPEPDWGNVIKRDSEWRDDKWLRHRFPPPKDFNPPYGGVAVLWARDEKYWKRIVGYRDWHCSLDSIYYQEFDHGKIIGSFPKHSSDKTDSVLFILTKDHRWDLQEYGTLKPSSCKQPRDNRRDNRPSGILDSATESVSSSVPFTR
jgi:hypothetical protein